MHLGLAQGLAEQFDGVVDSLEPREPAVAGCRLRFDVDAPKA
ncbi:MAG: hypothetical protein ACLFRT_14070 [Actinomycetota bacterium]